MADAEKPGAPTAQDPSSEEVKSNISPSPTSVSDGPPPEGGAATPPPGDKPAGDTPPAPGPVVQAEALTDGTVPTVLGTGSSHKSVSKGVASINGIYRKADILTTIFTFGGALVAAAIILGIYVYLTRTKTPTLAAPKITALDKTSVDKLNSFFEGNSAGSSAQVLTVESSSFFKNRVAVGADLKVVGGLSVSGTSALADLTVDKVSTLGVTNIRGSLGVAGPVTFQSPAQFGAGGTVNGNLAVTGNGSFGGSVSAGVLNVRDLTVSGTLSLAGHISISGLTPSASIGSEAGSGATASAEGNDASGSVTLNAGVPKPHVGNLGGLIVILNFRSSYPRAPHVVITAVGQNGARILPYVLITATGFTIGAINDLTSQQTYSFDYWVTQ
jgi:hypothetical protein